MDTTQKIEVEYVKVENPSPGQIELSNILLSIMEEQEDLRESERGA